MVKFIIVRHGFSESNVKATFTGQLDAPLSGIGHEQAEKVGEYVYRNFKIAAIYSSDLSRAVETIKPLSKLTGLKINTDVRLREIYGGKWQGVAVSDLILNYGDVYARWQKHDPDVRTDGGESMQELQARALLAIEDIAKDNDGKTVAICTHGGVIKVLQGAFLDLPMTEWKQKIPYVSNASITEVDYLDGKFIMKDTIDHYLGELKTQMPKGI